jgi:hypothetical protein
MPMKKNTVTKNPIRKYEKKIRWAKTEEEKQKWTQAKEAHLSRKVLSKKKKEIKDTISDDQLFAQAKKFNKSEKANKLLQDKQKNTETREMNKQKHSEVLEKMKTKEKKKEKSEQFSTDFKNEITLYKKVNASKIETQVKSMCKSMKSSERAARYTLEQQIREEVYEKVLREHRIKDIETEYELSYEEADEKLIKMEEDYKKFLADIQSLLQKKENVSVDTVAGSGKTKTILNIAKTLEDILQE